MITSTGLGSAEHKSCINGAARLHASQPPTSKSFLGKPWRQKEAEPAAGCSLPWNHPCGAPAEFLSLGPFLSLAGPIPGDLLRVEMRLQRPPTCFLTDWRATLAAVLSCS